MGSYLRALLPQPAPPTPVPQASASVAVPESTPIEPAADRGAAGKPDSPDTDDALSRDHELAAQAPSPHDSRLQWADEGSSRDQKDHPVTWRPDDPGTAIPDLRPLGLQLSQPEVEFMTRLGSLLPTPRAAKRLVNLYRLVRIGIPDAGLAAFTGSEAGGPYQVVQILLALLVGSPAAAPRIFHELMAATADTDILTIFAKAASADFAEGHLCAHIGAEMARIAEATPLLVGTGEYQRWCPALARYSFHTRTMTAEPLPSDVPPVPS